MKVLVVEDDEGTAAFIAAGLVARGHEPTVARDGREGYERVSANRFDVIVLDRMLPKLDGLGVVALMRRDRVSTPVLFLTNLSGIDDRVDGFEAGGDDYLVKPFAFEERHIAKFSRKLFAALSRSVALAVPLAAR